MRMSIRLLLNKIRNLKFKIKNKVIYIFLLLILVGTANATSITLATTTSTDNSGLLKVLLPPFEKKYDIRVDVVAVGTGKAIKLGQNGDADIILVHARAAEDKFVADGDGVNRRDVMHNDFVIIGPKNDPAGIQGAKTVVEALKKIASKNAVFVSRGDDSGTNKKEKALWAVAKIDPAGSWYNAVGQGMGATIQIADEKQGYTMADRGTYIAYHKKTDLVILLEGDKALFNPYGIIAVNPAKYPEIRYPEAMQLIAWVTGVEGQKIINDFKVDGKQLFYPDAVN